MPHRMCSEPDCERKVNARGLCGTHYRVVRQREIEDPCAVPGCGSVRALGCRSWCHMHYKRWKHDGDPGSPERRRKVRGSGWVDPAGYLVIRSKGHPVAHVTGYAYAHRVVLHDKIGPGEHPCHWCSAQVAWGINQASPDYLTADHLDWDRLNNVPENLVPSCLPCNGQRKQLGTLTGASHPSAKLTELQVSEIRASNLSHSQLAKRYGVSDSLIGFILQGKIWKNVS